MKVGKLIGNFKSILILLLIVILTYFFVFDKANITDIWHTILNCNVNYILLALISMFGFFVMEGLNIKLLFKNTDTNVSLLKCIKYSLIGFFFSGITPGATGGQPVEIYYMSKEGIKGFKSTLVLVIQLFTYKICALSLALIGFMINYASLNTMSKALFLCGFIVYLFPLSLIALCIFKPQFVYKLVDGFMNFINKLGIKKNADREKIRNTIEQYNECSTYFKHHKLIFLKSILISLVGVLCCYHVSYLVLCALGCSDLNVMSVIWRQSMLYAMASWFPLPGAAGASELTYINLFGFINNSDIIVSGLLLYRGITFYIFIIIGLIVYLITFIKNLKK